MKTINRLFIIALCMITSSMCAWSQSADNKKIAIETNLLWPFIPGINIYQLKFAPTIWRGERQYTELILGAYYRNTKESDDADKLEEVGGTIGARHFWYKEWHTEVFAHITNSQETGNTVDGKNYEGLSVLTEFYAGYRFNFKSQGKANWFITPQVGFGAQVYSDLGPEEDDSSVFPAASILLGVRF